MKTYHTLNTKIEWIDLLNSIQEEAFTLIDSNDGNKILAWGCEDKIIQKQYNSLLLNKFEQKHSADYIFGYLGYDAKNNFYKSEYSNNPDFHNFPESIFYVPQHILMIKNGSLMYFGTNKGFKQFNEIDSLKYNFTKKTKRVNLVCKSNYNTYKKNIELIHNHLQRGDIYEINYCLNFSVENCRLNVLETYLKLKKNTKAPFSTFFKFNDTVILSASPERFFTKRNKTIISQPIKGTAPRGTNSIKDKQIQIDLLNNQKEISENIMIVDLVRNDLSTIADKSSVSVPELCKLYSFETVHQLISTVKAQIPKEITFSEIAKHIFPMGSMTGAPKLSAIKIIEGLETFKRNIYSGTIGYIDPLNNMDFNVVIRSIIHNTTLKTVSVSVGGAITIKSTALLEYEECMLKLKKIEESIVV